MIVKKGDWIEVEIHAQSTWVLVASVYSSVTVCGFFLRSGEVMTQDFSNSDGRWSEKGNAAKQEIQNLPQFDSLIARLNRGPESFLPIHDRVDINEKQSRVFQLGKEQRTFV